MIEEYSGEQIDIKNELKKTEECQAILSNTIIGLYARAGDLNIMLQRADSLNHTASALTESVSDANLITKKCRLKYKKYSFRIENDLFFTFLYVNYLIINRRKAKKIIISAFLTCLIGATFFGLPAYFVFK